MKTWREKTKQLKNELHAIYLAYRNRRTPWYAKALIALIVAYALSPIDLIPDFIPVLGYLDDLLIVPGGIYLALKMIPQGVMAECREKARTEPLSSKKRWVGAVIVILIWLLALYLIGRLIWRIAS